jgi:S-DNA-T family DNA segregation ATPase FtsK/SpoIIIE
MAHKQTKTTPKLTHSKVTSPGKNKKPAGRRPYSGRASARSSTSRTVEPKPRSSLFKGKFAPPWKRKPSSHKAGPARSTRPINTGLSLDRKLDIVGVGLALLGLLTLLALLSPTNGSVTGSWVNAISKAFGWGMYLFPLSAMVIGLWLVLRNFERVPQLSVERLLGLVLLYTNILADLHFIDLPGSRQAVYDLAAQGKGGGYLGGFFFELLRANLGLGGAAIALLAWLLIALGLSLDVSVVELFRWLPPLFLRLQDWIDDRRSRRIPGLNGAPFSVPRPGAAQKSDAPPYPGVRPGSSTAVSQSFTIPASNLPAQPAHPWVLPSLDEILDKGSEQVFDDDFDRQRAKVIEDTLASFGAPVNVVEINRGPTITQFGVEPDFIETRVGRTRVRVGKIAALADDLALALSAKRIRVEAPVPGKGFVGIEVPNDEIALVALHDVVESEAFRRVKSSLRFALGQDVAGNAVAADLSVMPHLLIAGATGSGKSVCVNGLICCLLLNNTPDDLRLVMVDPKRVELTNYNGIPHLLAPVVVEMERVVGALQWVLREMDIRYHKLAEAGCRNISDYNARAAAQGGNKLPQLVVLVDELADLMMLAPEETERAITRLAQLARATGIHLVIATQRPSVDVVTGLIKANFPARIAFAVASGVDSRVVLDQPGAERLLGRGDMLFQAPDAPAPIRLQGAFVSENEIQRLVDFWRSQAGAAAPAPAATGGAVDAILASVPLKQMPLWDDMMAEDNADPLLNEAIDLVRRQGRASISMLQRRMRIGYTRAARLIETMQEKKIIGVETVGSGGFEILDYGPTAPPVEEQGD